MARGAASGVVLECAVSVDSESACPMHASLTISMHIQLHAMTTVFPTRSTTQSPTVTREDILFSHARGTIRILLNAQRAGVACLLAASQTPTGNP